MTAQKMDTYTAVGIAEGFIESDSLEQVLSAWATIARTGMYRNLQGFFGRNVERLVQQDLIDWDGNIYPENVD